MYDEFSSTALSVSAIGKVRPVLSALCIPLNTFGIILHSTEGIDLQP